MHLLHPLPAHEMFTVCRGLMRNQSHHEMPASPTVDYPFADTQLRLHLIAGLVTRVEQLNDMLLELS